MDRHDRRCFTKARANHRKKALGEPPKFNLNPQPPALKGQNDTGKKGFR